MMARRLPVPVLLLAPRPLAATDSSALAGATTSLAGDRDDFLGGGFAVGFESVEGVALTPISGCRPVERFGVGVGVGLTFHWSSYDWHGSSVDGTDHGLTLCSDCFIWQGPFARSEYEYLSHEEPLAAGGSDRSGYDAFEPGGGHAPPIARNASLRFGGSYDFSYDDRDSPCGDRWVINAGVSFGS